MTPIKAPAAAPIATVGPNLFFRSSMLLVGSIPSNFQKARLRIAIHNPEPQKHAISESVFILYIVPFVDRSVNRPPVRPLPSAPIKNCIYDTFPS